MSNLVDHFRRGAWLRQPVVAENKGDLIRRRLAIG
jgi:hypothetical protein